MARRRPGGQPGNKNAKGHRGANANSPGARRANERQAAARARSRAARVKAPVGVRLRGTVRGQVKYVQRNKRKFLKSAAKGVAVGLVAATATNIIIPSR